MAYTAKQIAEFLNGELIGDPKVLVTDFSRIEEGRKGTITFLANPKYQSYIYDTEADIVLVNHDLELEKPVKATVIKVQNAYSALASLMEVVKSDYSKKVGRDEMSFVSSTALLGKDIYLGAFAYIGEKTTIGDNCKIYPQVYIGDNVKIGENTILYPGVKVYHDSVIGENCIIHAGAVIGSDGFGFSCEGGIYHKIPQIGNVVIESDVEIGANTTIDRSVMGSTVIRRGVKLDNLIQIGHNCDIGENTAMAAQVGIAGSTKVEENCEFGGQVGIGGHITIGKNCRIGAQSGIISNTKAESKVMGSPAIPLKNFFKSAVIIPKLPDIYRELAALKKEVARLKKIEEQPE